MATSSSGQDVDKNLSKAVEALQAVPRSSLPAPETAEVGVPQALMTPERTGPARTGSEPAAPPVHASKAEQKLRKRSKKRKADDLNASPP